MYITMKEILGSWVCVDIIILRATIETWWTQRYSFQIFTFVDFFILQNQVRSPKFCLVLRIGLWVAWKCSRSIFCLWWSHLQSWQLQNTAGLAMDCSVGLHWHVAVAVGFQNQDQFCISRRKMRNIFKYFVEKSKNEGRFLKLCRKVEKWARTAKNDVFGSFSKNSIVFR